MNAIVFSSACRQLRISSKHIYKSAIFTGQHTYLRTSSVHRFQPRISTVSETAHQKLRKEYGLSNDNYVIYKEPKQELNHMIILKYLELVIYGSPLIALSYTYVENRSISSFINQDDFYIGVFIICVYLLGIRFFANGFVKIIFHNRATDVYRAYVLNKYKPTYKFVEFKAQDLKVKNLSPSIPMARNFFRVGNQNLILHDQLFASNGDQEKLIGNAIEQWHQRWRK